MNEKTINNLLDRFKEINKEKVDNEKKTLSKFNIFDICKITYDEVNMCRFLFELLNPKGRHLQGEKYLKVFFEKVLNYSPMPSDSELKKAIVLREELIEDKRRIDISINLKINKVIHYIPIEVKIYAEDQELQCFDYYRHALAKNDNDKTRTKVWYLTINGNYPSESSLKGLNYKLDNDQVVNCDEVQCISFRDILDYINGLINDISQENTGISEKQVLLQFKYAIENIIGGQIMTEAELGDILRIINDKESFSAAELIKDSFQYVVNDKLNRFLFMLYNDLEKRGWVLDDEEKINRFMMPKCTYPGVFKEFEYMGIKFLLRIELGTIGRLYFGICIHEAYRNEDNEKTLRKFVDENDLNLECKTNYYWITWQYLPNQNNDVEVPNFKYFNDTFYLLFEEDDSSIAENVKNIVDIVNDYEEKLSNSLKKAIDKKHI